MDEKGIYPLEVEESVMCMFCLRHAEFFFVFISTHGELRAVCDQHKHGV